MLNRSASLAMSTSVLKALPGKLDIKRHSPSILYLSGLIWVQTVCKGYQQTTLVSKEVSKILLGEYQSESQTAWIQLRPQQSVFVLMLYIPVSNFSLMPGHFPVFLRIMCLAQGHNTDSVAFVSLSSNPLILSLRLYQLIHHCGARYGSLLFAKDW